MDARGERSRSRDAAACAGRGCAGSAAEDGPEPGAVCTEFGYPLAIPRKFQILPSQGYSVRDPNKSGCVPRDPLRGMNGDRVAPGIRGENKMYRYFKVFAKSAALAAPAAAIAQDDHRDGRRNERQNRP